MRITEAEACVMEAVWSAGELAAADLLAQLCPAHDWSESTARTLIHRLMLKGALSSRRVPGGGAVYAPTVTREAWLAAEGQGLVDRLFGGELATLVALLTRERRPPPDDLARLRRLVAELDAGDED